LRIYFHLVGRTAVIPDTEGVEVDELGAARAAIAREIRELMQEFPEDERRGWQLRVTDDAGAVLFTVPLDSWPG
jgi:hypothetical protein